MFALGVHNPKFSQNIGHILRAADAYGASFVAYSGDRKAKVATDTSKAIRHIPTVHCDNLWDIIPVGLIPVAIELCDDAESLIDFIHPKNTFYFFGAEDATLGKLTLERCKHKVYVPTNICMNLSACVNVVLYDRLSKQK
jgi:tRNA(Leu) C34 or U34 (ribose-2'-O)-methylase TrmL